MSKVKHLAVAVSLVSVSTLVAHADDQRCNAPPYGGSVAEYKSFVKNFGSVVAPAGYLKNICNIKFGGANRTVLYNLGFSDEDISSKDTEDLAVDVIFATKQTLDKNK
jgi:hypothetical protein